jgi:hypothetical protein
MVPSTAIYELVKADAINELEFAGFGIGSVSILLLETAR